MTSESIKYITLASKILDLGRKIPSGNLSQQFEDAIAKPLGKEAADVFFWMASFPDFDELPRYLEARSLSRWIFNHQEDPAVEIIIKNIDLVEQMYKQMFSKKENDSDLI